MLPLFSGAKRQLGRKQTSVTPLPSGFVSGGAAAFSAQRTGTGRSSTGASSGPAIVARASAGAQRGPSSTFSAIGLQAGTGTRPQSPGRGARRPHLGRVAGAAKLLPVGLHLELELLGLLDVLLRLLDVGLLGRERGALEPARGVVLDLPPAAGEGTSSRRT